MPFTTALLQLRLNSHKRRSLELMYFFGLAKAAWFIRRVPLVGMKTHAYFSKATYGEILNIIWIDRGPVPLDAYQK